MQNKNNLLAGAWLCEEKEHRKLYRRKIIVPVEVNEHYYRYPRLVRNYVGFGESGAVAFNG